MLTRRLVNALILLALLAGSLLPQAAGRAEDAGQESVTARAQALVAKMSAEEKVGQLFLVTFKGTSIDASTQIYDLITNHYVGGVILSDKNDNFVGGSDTIPQAYQLVAELQNDRWRLSQQAVRLPRNGQTITPAYVPLFIGISQDGDGYPSDQILSGMTALPDELALGATWKPELAKQVGAVLGSELQALGFNLLLGPSLDLLEMFQPEGGGDLGAMTFGGDPYWAGQMGQAYIAGVHQGSEGRVAVVAEHFPGLGGADRLPEDEVATVRKSLEQLKQIDLAPFFAVTGSAPSSDEAADALLISHIRVQGLQNNIRDTTKPVSLDPQAFSLLMSLPEFAPWREAGGLVISDNLGSRAVRRFYDPLLQTFDSRQVALNAFLAGNDVLYVDNFTASGDSDSYTSVVRTLDYFAQKYREDSAFAQRVDAAVQRILMLKLRTYKAFSIAQVVPPEAGLELLGKSQIAFEVARDAATLINPSPEDLNSVIPNPPGPIDRLVFITDVMAGKQCSTCPERVTLPVDGLQSTVMRLYGPLAGGKVYQNRMSSYSFTDLQGMLNGVEGLPPLENDLRTADWIVIAMLDVNSARPDSVALRRLLSERPDLLRNKKVIVFAFNAPYYLDATDISKISAYYAMYSKIPAFVEVAARVLFQELAPRGALPVSVPGIGYDLFTATAPDPGQVIPLYLDLPAPTPTPEVEGTPATPQPSLTPTSVPTFKVGDTIPLRTGVILDHNGNPVPDGSVVHFIVTRGGEAGGTQQQQATANTTQGVARTAIRIESAGVLEIRVESDPAKTSNILRLDITGGTGAAITVIAPTPLPSETPQPTTQPTPTFTPEPTHTPLRTGYPGFGEWIAAMLVVAAGAILAYSLGNLWVSMQWGVRWALCAVLGGVAAYLYLAIGLPGGIEWVKAAGTGGVLLSTLAGIGLGWGFGVGWRALLQGRQRRKAE